MSENEQCPEKCQPHSAQSIMSVGFNTDGNTLKSCESIVVGNDDYNKKEEYCPSSGTGNVSNTIPPPSISAFNTYGTPVYDSDEDTSSLTGINIQDRQFIPLTNVPLKSIPSRIQDNSDGIVVGSLVLIDRCTRTMLQPRVMLSKMILGAYIEPKSLEQMGLHNNESRVESTIASMFASTFGNNVKNSPLLICLVMFEDDLLATMRHQHYPFPMISSLEPLEVGPMSNFVHSNNAEYTQIGTMRHSAKGLPTNPKMNKINQPKS